MSDDERERFAAALVRAAPWYPDIGAGMYRAAAQLRADGERIKALEAAIEVLLYADERGQGIGWVEAMKRCRALLSGGEGE